ncbi:hypothetical protein A2U01_0052509, partial [Trifolium medium]|nr:hypothetical protein [Trifolium medium]
IQISPLESSVEQNSGAVCGEIPLRVFPNLLSQQFNRSILLRSKSETLMEEIHSPPPSVKSIALI